MTFKDYFSQQAADYASYRPRYPDALFTWLAQHCAAHEQVWDCATGNGQAAIALTAHFQQIIATDGSATQLQQAIPHPQIHYRLALATASGLPAHTVDLVTVAQAAHWFDLERFYAEVRRVLKPGGLLALWCYGLPTLSVSALDHILQHYYSHTLAPFWPPERQLIESGYRTLKFPFNAIAPPPLVMQANWTLGELTGYLYTWSGTQRYIAHHQANPLDALVEPLAAAWESDRQTLTWPLSLRVGRV